MKNVKYLIVMLLVLIIPHAVKAIDVDINTKGSMDVVYKYGQKRISDSDIYIYEVAKYNSDSQLTYTTEFRLTDNLEVHTTSEVIRLIQIINNYIKENEIGYNGVCTTNERGKCKFEQLDPGLYLIVTTSKTDKNFQYYANPSIVLIPERDEVSGELKYDRKINIKTEVHEIDCPDCKLEEYKITTSVVNGTITASNSVVEGDSYTVSYKPYDGYKLEKIEIDGKEIDKVKYKDSYTFTDVKSEHIINVIYTKMSIIDIISPSTGDDLVKYVTGLMVSITAISVILILYNKKKRDDESERKKV